MPGHFHFPYGVVGEGDADSITEPFRQQYANAHSRFYRPAQQGACLGNARVQGVGAAAGKQAEIIKVTDFAEIAAYGVMSTPGLVVDEKVVSTGKVLTAEEIGRLI